MPLDLPFPFTLPRLFRSPAILNFFPFPLGRNSGVRLYFTEILPCYLLAFTVLLQNKHTTLAENGENLISAQPRISAHLE